MAFYKDIKDKIRHSGNEKESVRGTSGHNNKNHSGNQLLSYIINRKLPERTILRSFQNLKYVLDRRGFKKINSFCRLENHQWGHILEIIDFDPEEISSLSLMQTERAIDVLILFKYGVEVYGTLDEFKEWLNGPNTYFDGRPPEDLLIYSHGLNELHRALHIIDYGQTA